MTPERKKDILGGVLLFGGIFYTIRYGSQPRVTSDSVDFDNLPAKTLGIAVSLVGAYILFKKKK